MLFSSSQHSAATNPRRPRIMLDERTDEYGDGTGMPLAEGTPLAEAVADGSSTLPAHEQLAGGVERMALSLDEPPAASLLALPDGVHYALCALLDVRGCLGLRSACLLLRAVLTGPDADLGVWKPRALALAPSTGDGPCTPLIARAARRARPAARAMSGSTPSSTATRTWWATTAGRSR